MTWGKAVRQVEKVIYCIITVGSRSPFWCDSHPMLCFCCGRFRTWLRGHAEDFRYFKGCSIVIDRWQTLWFFRSEDFDPPYVLRLGGNTVIVTFNAIVRYKEGTVVRYDTYSGKVLGRSLGDPSKY